SPGRAWSWSSSKTCATSPISRRTVRRPLSDTAIPADSWPRCWSANRPKYARRATSRSSERIPKTPHMSVARLPSALEAPELHTEEGTSACLTDPPERHAQLARNTLDLAGRLRRAGDDRAAADLAEELDGVVTEIERRAGPGHERGLRKPPRHPPLGRVVRERRYGSDSPEERDEPRLGLQVERGWRPAELPVVGLELRARKRHLRGE